MINLFIIIMTYWFTLNKGPQHAVAPTYFFHIPYLAQFIRYCLIVSECVLTLNKIGNCINVSNDHCQHSDQICTHTHIHFNLG